MTVTPLKRYRFDDNRNLLEAVAERLGVRPAEEPATPSSSVPSSDAIAALVGLLADPAGAAKRVAELKDAAAKARDAVEAAKQARAERDRLDVEIADARRAHDERLANELSAHTVAMQSRTRNVEGREQAVAEREKQLKAEWDQITATRADLKKRLDAIRKAAE